MSKDEADPTCHDNTMPSQQDLYALSERLVRFNMGHASAVEAHIASYNMLVHLLSGIVNGTMLFSVDRKSKKKLIARLDGLTFRRPSIQECDRFTNENITPNECMQRNIDYVISAHVSVSLHVGDYNGDESTLNPPKHTWLEGTQQVMRYNNIPLFTMPCMVGSQLCNSHRMVYPYAATMDVNTGGPYGCFILQGQEKHVVLPIDMRHNIPITNIRNTEDGYITHASLEFRANHEMALRTTSTLHAEIKGTAIHRFQPTLTVSVQFIATRLDLVAIFRILGIDTVEQMQFLMEVDPAYNGTMYNSVVEHLLQTSSHLTSTRNDILFNIGKSKYTSTPRGLSREQVRARVIRSACNLFMHEFMPHVIELGQEDAYEAHIYEHGSGSGGDDDEDDIDDDDDDNSIDEYASLQSSSNTPNVQKVYLRRAQAFAWCMRHLIRVYLGLDPENMRDTIRNMRVVDLGLTWAKFFRNLFETRACPIFETQMRKALNHKDAHGHTDILQSVIEQFPKLMSKNAILMSKHMRRCINSGNFTIQQSSEGSGRGSMSQHAVRMNQHAAREHMANLKKGCKDSRNTDMRQLGCDLAGFVGLANTTDGKECGNVTPKANMVYTRTYVSTTSIVRAVNTLYASYGIRDDDVAADESAMEGVVFESIVPADVDNNAFVLKRGVWVFVNGTPLWRTRRPQELMRHLRQWKRQTGVIPCHISVAWINRTRLNACGEIHIGCDMGEMLTPLFVVENLHLIHRLKPDLQGASDADTWKILIDNGIVEWVGAEEKLCDTDTLTAQGINYIDPKRHTWSEIEPSVQLVGPNATFMPGANRDQGPRNSYRCIDFDSEVMTEDGTMLPIRQIEVGSRVWGFEGRTMEPVLTKVLGKCVQRTAKPMFKLELEKRVDPHSGKVSGGNVLFLTGDHRVRVRVVTKESDTPFGNKGQHTTWIEAKDLVPKRHMVWCLLLCAGAARGKPVFYHVPVAVASCTFVPDHHHWVADLTTSNATFYAQGMAVHNSAMKRQEHGSCTPTQYHEYSTTQFYIETPQRPLVTVLGGECQGDSENPTSQNAIVVTAKFNDEGIEDAIIANKASVERGFGRSVYKRTYRAKAGEEKGRMSFFGLPDPSWCRGMRKLNYNKLNPLTGAPDPGTVLDCNDIIIGRYNQYKLTRSQQKQKNEDRRHQQEHIQNKRKRKRGHKAAAASAVDEDDDDYDDDDDDMAGSMEEETERYEYSDQSIPVKHTEYGVVVSVVIRGVDDRGDEFIKVVTTQTRRLQQGDKISDAHAQKGIISRLVPPEDLPFTASGMQPDLIVNPCGNPSRMTMGRIIECSMGKVAALRGRRVDMTPFRELEPGIGEALMEYGFHWTGEEVMYDGITGLKMEHPVAIGIMSIGKLKHMVADKIQARGRGPMVAAIEQPTEGRAHEGGLRFGDMERDSMVCHGAADMLTDRLTRCSDGKNFKICTVCSCMAELDPDTRTFVCRRCSNAVRCGAMQVSEMGDITHLEMPQTVYLLQQSLACMHISLGFNIQEKS